MNRPPPPSTETPGPRRPVITLADLEAVIRQETTREDRHLSRLSRVARLRGRG